MVPTLLRTLGRGSAAGLAGTAAMTASYGVERRLRHSHGGPLDYDDSTVPSHAAMVVLRIQALDEADRRRLGFLVHWGYGSVVGTARVLLGRRLRPLPATAAYWGGLMVMTGALFPLLGGTPPPWRWKRDVIATSLVQHAVYAAVCGLAVDLLEPRGAPGH